MMHPAFRAVGSVLSLFFACACYAQSVAPRLLVSDATLLKAAENTLVLSDGRVIVAYNGGLNQLQVQNGTQATVKPLKVPQCYYAGLVEAKGYLYAVCSSSFGSILNQARLVVGKIGSDLSQVAFQSITLSSVYGANGLAVDPLNDTLYMADSGLYLPNGPGKIVALKLATPTSLASKKTVFSSTGRPNGVRFDAAARRLYFTENSVYQSSLSTSTIKRASLDSTGALTGVSTVYSVTGNYLDDFVLTTTGIAVTRGGTSEVALVNEAMGVATVLTKTDGQATSVGFSTLSGGDLLVTDGKTNAVYAVSPAIALQPR